MILNLTNQLCGALQIKPVLSKCWTNRILTGVAFCGSGFDDVAVVAYDTEEVMLCKLDL